MGCISCKIVKPEIFKKRNLCGKARLPGIPKAMRKNKVSPGKTDHEDPNSPKMLKGKDASEKKNGILKEMRKNKVSPGKTDHEDPNSPKILKDASEKINGIPKAIRKNKVSAGKTDHEGPNSPKMLKGKDASEKKNGILKQMRNNNVSPGKTDHEDPNSPKILKGKDASERIYQDDMHIKINKEIANILVQIEKTHNKVKKTREEFKGKMGEIPSHLTGCSQKISDVSPNISVSTGASYEKRKRKDARLENDPMQGKGRLGKLTEGKRPTVGVKKEKSCKPIMNDKTCEENLRHVREIRQQLTTETNSFASENAKSKEYAKNKIGNLSGDDSFKERRNYLLNKYTNYHIKEDNNTLPGVDV